MSVVKSGWKYLLASAVVVGGAILSSGLATVVTAQSAPAAGEVTFTKDIAPILQRSCQNCHRPDGVAPMSLTTFEEVRRSAA